MEIDYDPMKIEKIIEDLETAQANTIDLVASDSWPSAKVRKALSSPLVGVYAEGYPGKRYYAGFNFMGKNMVDELEKAVQKLAQRAFSTKYHVNVQAHSGSEANFIVYNALMSPNDKMMGMKLSHGGHLTHGHPKNRSGQEYRVLQYGVNEKGIIDYKELEKLAVKYKPKVIVSGASAYPRDIDFARISSISKRVGAYHVADIAHTAGLVATGYCPSPFEADVDVVTMTTHKTLSGPRGALIFCKPELAKKIDRSVFPESQGGPHLHTIASIGLMLREVLKPKFHHFMAQVQANAMTLAYELKKYGFDIVSGTTDNHLVLIDLRNVKGMNGEKAEKLLSKKGIRANKNTVPGDTSPLRPSGIRFGTTVVTARRYKEAGMKKLAKRIAETLTE
jgi:glycine hydroxymethyltransferase